MFDYAVAIDWMDLTLGCRPIFTIEDVCWDQWNWLVRTHMGIRAILQTPVDQKYTMELLILMGPLKKHFDLDMVSTVSKFHW